MNFARYGIINAKKYPDTEYLVERKPSEKKRRSLTWKEFNEETNKVANYLQKKMGIQKGDFVLHLQMNSLEWVVTFHAILRVGAAAVPLSFRFASADIQYAAAACSPKAFILDEGFLSKVEPIKKEMGSISSYICIGDNVPEGMTSYHDIIKTGDPADILVDVQREDPAELMFTSGTTGPPKPVCQSHDTLYQIGIGNALTFSLGYETVYFNPHPFYHSGSFFLNFPSYLAGGTTIILTELNDPKYLLDTICEEKVNDGQVSVPTMSDLVNAIKKGVIDITKYDLSHFTGSMFVGAQPVPSSLFQDMKKIFPFKTGNIYGITEGGGGGLTNLYDEDVLTKPGSIGKPTFNVETRIVDENGKDVSVGEVGELIIYGPRNMKEYFRNPEMTAITLKNGWLYTGDLVKADEEGYIFIADRKKDLIIRGGENIFPVEIEDVLRRHPKVADVAVIGYPHERLVEISMAIVQLYPGETMEEKEVVDFCSQHGLAKYKWPERIVFNDIIRNATGKIDKPKLREKYIGRKEIAMGE
ncbi:MAG: class I adenylate-forming enzyme family protein [Bacillota bacterium]|nr:class I adenylate-forming enzyme family protein [Bacillota bacterium]